MGFVCGYPVKPERVVEFILDITFRKDAEESLLDAERRKDEFLAHELRNLMATLSNTLIVLELTGGMND